MTAVAAQPHDIDSFIRSQKAKLARERQQLHQKPAEKPPAKDNFVPPLIRDQQLSALQAEQDHWTVTPRGGIQAGNIPPGVAPPRADEERPIAEKLGEWERRRQAYNAERREEYNKLVSEDRARGSMRPADRHDPEYETGNALPGQRDDSEIRRQQKEQRNAEYNKQKQLADEKLRNRFAHRKPAAGRPAAQTHRPPAASRAPPALSTPPRQSSPLTKGYPAHLGVQNYVPAPPELQQNFLRDVSPRRDNAAEQVRLDELERRVEELRGRSLAEQRLHPPPPRESSRETRHRQPPPGPVVPVPPLADLDIQTDTGGASLPIKDRMSAETRKRNQRNREYNEMMAVKDQVAHTRRAIKDDFGSPAYEDILTQKRMEESAYRRLNDPEFAPARARAVNRVLPPDPSLDAAERQLAALESDYETQKVRLLRGGGGGGGRPLGTLLDDDNWLRNAGRQGPKSVGGARVTDELDLSLSRATGPRSRPFRDGVVTEPFATLPVGRPDSAQVRQKNKEVYKQQLQQQMKEDERKKILQKAEDRTNDQNENVPRSRSVSEGLNLSGGRGAPGSLLNSNQDNAASGLPGLSPYNTPADDAYFYYGMKNPLEASGYGEDPLLAGVDRNQPLGGSLNRSGGGERTARAVRFEQQATPNGLVFSSEEDRKENIRQQKEAYRLELLQQADEVKRRNLERKRQQEEYDRKKEEEIAAYNPFGKGGGGAPLTDNDGNVTANLKEVLAGGGPGGTTSRTPRKPSSSSDPSLGLSEFQRRLDESLNKTSIGGGGGWVESPRAVSGPSGPGNPLKSPRQTNAHGEVTHARGGHGIFGEPETNEQRSKKEKYQEALRIQVEEQKKVKEMERERQRLEDEKEQQRLEQQQQRIQAEFEEEQKKQRDKEEEVRRKNEEIRKQAEEKKAEAAEKRKQEAAAALEFAQQERTQRALAKSPPVPAARTASRTEHQSRTPPPPVNPPAPRELQERDDSLYVTQPAVDDDVLSQLAQMRNQLQQERRKVENALYHQQNDVEVFDPRLQNRTAMVRHPMPMASTSDLETVATPDAFERARRGHGPVYVKRGTSRESRRPLPGEPADPGAVAEFKKYRQRNGSAQERLRQAYPETPITTSALEAQQLSLLREQEARLRRMRNGGVGDGPLSYEMPGMAPRDLGLRPDTRTSVNQLQSDSAFLDANGAVEFGPVTPYQQHQQPDLLRLDTADSNPLDNGFGSQASLDIDRLARRNERRLEKLQRLQAEANYTRRGHNDYPDPDTVSLEDPDAVLNRFMARDIAERPPSGQTLMDDTWMHPGR